MDKVKRAIAETNSLVYTGEVTIRKIKCGEPYKVVKKRNKSTKGFHKFLLNCMLGNFDIKQIPLTSIEQYYK